MTTRGRDYLRVGCELDGKSGQIVLDQLRTVDKTRLVKRQGTFNGRKKPRCWMFFGDFLHRSGLPFLRGPIGKHKPDIFIRFEARNAYAVNKTKETTIAMNLTSILARTASFFHEDIQAHEAELGRVIEESTFCYWRRAQ